MGCGSSRVDDHPKLKHPHIEKFDENPDLEAILKNLSQDSEVPNSFSGEQFGEKGFYKLRDECLERNMLFEDHDFPASKESIGYSDKVSLYNEWKRPFEICQDPQFVVEDASKFDVVQGELGDCWLLSALSNLTQNPIQFNHMVPRDQSFGKDYAGIFHFRFWQCHKGWVEVIIDDRLPTQNGQLVFLHSQEKNEFWSALMEKAYAKLKGSYEALRSEDPLEAMKEFNCRSVNKYNLKEEGKKGEKFFNILLQAYEGSSLMECHIISQRNKNCSTSQLRKKGLIAEHAYSITAVQRVKKDGPYVYGEALLIRLRNPWGTDVEWTGPWSDKSKEWKSISNRRKKELDLTFEADGEFWMSFEDFMENFTTVEICHFQSDLLDDKTDSKN